MQSDTGARIDDDVDDVDDRVGEQHADDDEQEHALDDEIVLVLDAREYQPTKAWIGKDDFSDQRATNDGAELQREAVICGSMALRKAYFRTSRCGAPSAIR